MFEKSVRITKLLIALILIAAVAVAAIFIYDYFYKKPDRFEPTFASIPEAEEKVKDKLKIESALVTQFESKKELIVLEAELSDVAEWDESWGGFDFFHKSQKMRFYGTGIYVVDLDEVNEDDIFIDEENKKVTIIVPRPFLKTVTIDETKNEYQDVDRGWLRFGDIKMAPQDYTVMYNSVKQSMEAKLISDTYYSQARDHALISVRGVFQKVTSVIDANYELNVRFAD